MTVEERLEKLENLLLALVDRQQAKEWYSVEEFARIVGRAEFTVRSWCRQGRILARKKASGRGGHTAWAISNEALQQYRRNGLLPVS